jgi:hypothetical protein
MRKAFEHTHGDPIPEEDIGINFLCTSVDDIFSDQESKQNLIGLFDLLLKIDKRIHPELYKHKPTHQKYD